VKNENENETKMRRKMATADSGTMQLRIKGRDLENSRGRTLARATGSEYKLKILSAASPD
jgi:hypothetical protein